MKIITSILNLKQLEDNIDYIINFFKANKQENIIIMYGWDCETDQQYVDIKKNINNLKKFIKNSHEKKIFNLGKSDLYITAKNKKSEFLLCHESDIHFESKDLNLVKRVKNYWIKKGYRPYETKG